MSKPEDFTYITGNKKYHITVGTGYVPVFQKSGDSYLFSSWMEHDMSALTPRCEEQPHVLYIALKNSQNWAAYKYEKISSPVDKYEEVSDLRAHIGKLEGDISELQRIVKEQGMTILEITERLRLLTIVTGEHSEYIANIKRSSELNAEIHNANSYWHKSYAASALRAVLNIDGDEYISTALYVHDIIGLGNHERFRNLVSDYETKSLKIEELYIEDTTNSQLVRQCMWNNAHTLRDASTIGAVELIRDIIWAIYRILPNLRHLEIGREYMPGLNRFKQPYNPEHMFINRKIKSNGVECADDINAKTCGLTLKYLTALCCGKLKTVKLGALYGVVITAQNSDLPRNHDFEGDKTTFADNEYLKQQLVEKNITLTMSGYDSS